MPLAETGVRPHKGSETALALAASERVEAMPPIVNSAGPKAFGREKLGRLVGILDKGESKPP